MNSNHDFDELDSFIKETYNSNKLRRVKRKKIIIVLINIFSITCLVAGGVGIKNIYDYKKDLKENKILQEKLKNSYVELKEIQEKETELGKQELLEKLEELEKKQPDINFTTLLNTNSDTVGWLTIKNTTIDLPIVQTTDNKYYLTHNFENKWNSLGWAFVDYRNNMNDLDKNTIIYGHTYKDTLIFSNLTETLKDSWQNNEDNLIINFSTLTEKQEWQIFSIYTLKKTDDYLNINFADDEFMEFINLIKGRSIKDFHVDVTSNDKILTLSTCYIDSNHRLVVHAKLI